MLHKIAVLRFHPCLDSPASQSLGQSNILYANAPWLCSFLETTSLFSDSPPSSLFLCNTLFRAVNSERGRVEYRDRKAKKERGRVLLSPHLLRSIAACHCPSHHPVAETRGSPSLRRNTRIVSTDAAAALPLPICPSPSSRPSSSLSSDSK